MSKLSCLTGLPSRVSFISGWPLSAMFLVIAIALSACGGCGHRGPNWHIYNINNLKQISLALYMYHDQYGSFPPAYVADDQGNPMHSWRVLILPFVEEEALYKQYRFDEPWNGPNNSKLHNQSPAIFADAAPSNNAPTETRFLAIVGPDTVWPGATTTKLSDITDGSSKTLMLVEVPNSGIHWMEPRDLDVKQVAATLRGRPAHAQGNGVVFADVYATFLDGRMPNSTLDAMTTIAGGEKIEIER